jgi:hypothetical protein
MLFQRRSSSMQNANVNVGKSADRLQRVRIRSKVSLVNPTHGTIICTDHTPLLWTTHWPGCRAAGDVPLRWAANVRNAPHRRLPYSGGGGGC